MTYPSVTIFGVTGIPEIQIGDDLAGIILTACNQQATPLETNDVLVITQKIVSKSEGCLINLDSVTPSAFAV